MSNDQVREEMDALRTDLAKLRKDISGLSEAVQTAAGAKLKHTKEQVTDSTKQAWEDVSARLEELLGEGKQTVDKLEGRVAEHPAASLLAAFGIGFVIAKLFGKGCQR